MSRPAFGILTSAKRLGTAFGATTTRGLHSVICRNLNSEDITTIAEAAKKNDFALPDLTQRGKVSHDFTRTHISAQRKFYKDYDTSIVGLDFGNNNVAIGDEGMARLAEGLAENKTVRLLNLNGNAITNKGAKNIAELLTANNSLLYLNISDNNLDDQAIPSLGNALEANIMLSRIVLTRNKISHAGYQELLKYFERNTALWHNFDEYPYDDEGRDALATILVRNTQIAEAFDDYCCVLKARLFRSLNGDADPDRKFILPAEIAGELDDELRIMFKQMVLAGKTNTDAFAIFEHWKENQFKIRRVRIGAKTEWPSILGFDKSDAEIEELDIPEEAIGEKGWKIVVRHSAAALVQEGEDMKHCVGGYTADCTEKNSHVMSIVNAQGKSLSTFMLKLDYWHRDIVATEHVGFKDSAPSEQCLKAFNWIVSGIKSGTIPVDYKYLEQQKIARNLPVETFVGRATQLVGFNPLNTYSYNKGKEGIVKSNAILPAYSAALKEFSRQSVLSLNGIILNGESDKIILDESRNRNNGKKKPATEVVKGDAKSLQQKVSTLQF